MGRDFVGVWTGLHPLFAFLFGGDSCCFCCCLVFDFGFCPKRDFIITGGDIGNCRSNGGFHYGLSFGLFAGGLGCTGSRFAEKVALYGLFSGGGCGTAFATFRGYLGTLFCCELKEVVQAQYRGREKGKFDFFFRFGQRFFHGSGCRFGNFSLLRCLFHFFDLFQYFIQPCGLGMLEELLIEGGRSTGGRSHCEASSGAGR